MRWFPALSAWAILILSVPAGGQEQSGAIEGRVLDLTDRPLAGVSVWARSTGGTSVEAATDQHGMYRFPSLLPGSWELEARMEDVTPSRVEGVELFLGQLLTVDLALDIARFSDTVEVKTTAPLLDLKQSARSWSLRAEEIEKLPGTRSFVSFMTMAPGANYEPRNRGISIDGSSGTENRHIIDGAETTDPVMGSFLGSDLRGLDEFAERGPFTQQQMLTLTDFVEELQVKSSGYAAEYGGATGGVINVVTRSGTNRWQGEVSLNYNADWLDGDPRPFLRFDPIDVTQASYRTDPKNDYDRWEPGFSVGGPLRRDKLWLFAGYHRAKRTTEGTVTFLVDGVTQTREADARTDHGTINLTAQFSPRLRLRAAYHLQDQSRESLPLSEDPRESTNPDLDDVFFATHDTVSAVVDFLPSNRFFVSFHGGFFRGNFYDNAGIEGPQLVFGTPNIGLPGVPEELQRSLFFDTGSNFSSQRNVRERLGLQLDGTYFFTGAGEHQLKAGVQWSEVAHEELIGGKGPQIVLFWDLSFLGQRGEFGYYHVLGNDIFPELGSISYGDVQSEQLGLFVQDSWTIAERLTLNVGLRSEREKIPSYSVDPRIPATAFAFDFADKLAPRLGFAWDVRGDGRWKAYGSWGLYYDITKLSLPSAYFGSRSGTIGWYTLDTPDWPSLARPGCPPDCPGELIFGPTDLGLLLNDPEMNAIDPDIEPMRLQEWSLGIEHELTPRIALGLRYLHKQVDVALEDIGAVDAEGNDIFVIGNPGRGRATIAHVSPGGSTVPYPEAERDYDALELTVDKRMANRWFGRFSYVWSRLEGNYSGLSDSEFRSSGSPNLNAHFDHPFMPFDESGRASFGRLATDRPHQLKLQFLYDFPTDTSVGVFWNGMSGLPRTRRTEFFDGGRRAQVLYRARESDGRMGFLHRTDLYVQHELRLGARSRLTLFVNVLNLFDQDEPTHYWAHELFFFQSVSIPRDQFFRGFDTQRLIEEQAPLRDPRFLQDIFFQPPREIRLGVRFSI